MSRITKRVETTIRLPRPLDRRLKKSLKYGMSKNLAIQTAVERYCDREEGKAH